MTHYDVLGVESDASSQQIRAAYRRRARATHPDTGGSAAEFATVAIAWEVLSSPDARASYDDELAADDDGGWGEDVGFDEPAPRRSPYGAPPGFDAPFEPPPPRRDHPGEPEDGAEDEPDDEVVDPFTSPPRVLPGLTEQLAAVLPARRRYVSVAVYWFLPAVLLVIVGGGVLIASGLSPVGGAAFAAMLVFGAWVVVGAAARLGCAGWRWFVRAFAAVFLWGGVAIYAAAAAEYVAAGGVARAIVVIVPWLGAVTLGATAEYKVATARHRLREAAAVRSRHELAQSWNGLLRAREQNPGRLVRATAGSGPSVRRAWVLRRSSDGVVVATAPLEAPAAWAHLLRLSGLDVLDPEHTAEGPSVTPAANTGS